MKENEVKTIERELVLNINDKLVNCLIFGIKIATVIESRFIENNYETIYIYGEDLEILTTTKTPYPVHVGEQFILLKVKIQDDNA